MDYEIISKTLWVCSITILITGVIAPLIKGYHDKYSLLPIYIIAILLLEFISYFYSDYHTTKFNIFLFHLSGFIHFFFIVLIQSSYFNRKARIKTILFILIGLLLLIPNLFVYDGVDNFQLYENIIYNLLIVSFSFSYFLFMILSGEKPKPLELFFNSAILVFFTFDAVISLSSNFLVNEHISLVAPIWLFRTFLLQIFYVSIINYSWQTGKNLKQ